MITKQRLKQILSETSPSCSCYTAANQLSDAAQIDVIVTMYVSEWKELSPLTYQANKVKY